MQKNVETNEVKEANAANELTEYQESIKYPEFDIQKMTAPGASAQWPREIIRMHATSKTTYDKFYCPMGLSPDGAPKPIRRTKHVKLPVSIDGRKFDTTIDLWEYLMKYSKYSRAPKQARRDKITR